MSKEVGKAIYELKEELGRSKVGFTSYLAGQFGDDIETVLKYIEELERELKTLRNRQCVGKYTELTGENLDNVLSKWYINKQKIRDKISEIKDRKITDMFITASEGKLNTIIELEKLLEE